VFDTMMGDDDEVESDGGEVVAPIAVNRPARATAKKGTAFCIVLQDIF
jgi:hypothetical protein